MLRGISDSRLRPRPWLVLSDEKLFEYEPGVSPAAGTDNELVVITRHVFVAERTEYHTLISQLFRYLAQENVSALAKVREVQLPPLPFRL